MDAALFIWETIRDFLERGGNVITVIAWVIFIKWIIIFDRVFYLHTEHPRRLKESLAEWERRPDPDSWNSDKIYTAMASQITQRLEMGIPLIKTLAAICPLLGLLGTVTGMVVIFDVIAAVGTSSPRSVASGVAQATMTTMAGMVGALSGLFPAFLLARRVGHEHELLSHGHHASQAIQLPFGSHLPAAARVFAAVCLSFVVTMALVFLMQTLIETGKEALTDYTPVTFADFIRVRQDETVQRKDMKPDKPPPPEIKPQDIPPPADSNVDPNAGQISVGFSSPTGRLDVNVSGISGYAIADADYMPIVKVLPIYPRRAAVRGLEGWVLVQFTVTVTGAVRDVEVVESSHPLFERAAVQAALKFKYKPRVVNGIPVEVTGVLHYINFDLEDV